MDKQRIIFFEKDDIAELEESFAEWACEMEQANRFGSRWEIIDMQHSTKWIERDGTLWHHLMVFYRADDIPGERSDQ